jgi:hypothetical protein
MTPIFRFMELGGATDSSPLLSILFVDLAPTFGGF